jgi:hypothetical protein
MSISSIVGVLRVLAQRTVPGVVASVVLSSALPALSNADTIVSDPTTVNAQMRKVGAASFTVDQPIFSTEVAHHPTTAAADGPVVAANQRAIHDDPFFFD